VSVSDILIQVNEVRTRLRDVSKRLNLDKNSVPGPQVGGSIDHPVNQNKPSASRIQFDRLIDRMDDDRCV
jgi:hypothetical protein